MSQIQPVSDRVIITDPPTGARFGCALTVLTLMMLVITQGLVVAFLYFGLEMAANYKQYGPDGATAYLNYLFTDQHFQVAAFVLIVMFGLTVAAPIMAFVESKDFLIWLKRRA